MQVLGIQLNLAEFLRIKPSSSGNFCCPRKFG